MTKHSIKNQFKQNLLAIISLAVAISALSYNTWRNEQTENNRNYRAAGFEILRESAKLQLLIDRSTYSLQQAGDNTDYISGWVSINLIQSLADLMTQDIQNQATKLKAIWAADFSMLNQDESANQRISKANNLLISSVNQELSRLY